MAKLQSLGERLGGRTDALHERGLVLDEATRLTDSLREGAAAGRGTAAALSGAANTYQQRLHAATRALMATISELSLYQATALKLAAHKATLERQVADAHARVAAGEPPTQDADAEWATMARREEMMRELRHERDQVCVCKHNHAYAYLLVTTITPIRLLGAIAHRCFTLTPGAPLPRSLLLSWMHMATTLPQQLCRDQTHIYPKIWVFRVHMDPLDRSNRERRVHACGTYVHRCHASWCCNVPLTRCKRCSMLGCNAVKFLQ